MIKTKYIIECLDEGYIVTRENCYTGNMSIACTNLNELFKKLMEWTE